MSKKSKKSAEPEKEGDVPVSPQQNKTKKKKEVKNAENEGQTPQKIARKGKERHRPITAAGAKIRARTKTPLRTSRGRIVRPTKPYTLDL